MAYSQGSDDPGRSKRRSSDSFLSVSVSKLESTRSGSSSPLDSSTSGPLSRLRLNSDSRILLPPISRKNRKISSYKSEPGQAGGKAGHRHQSSSGSQGGGDASSRRSSGGSHSYSGSGSAINDSVFADDHVGTDEHASSQKSPSRTKQPLPKISPSHVPPNVTTLPAIQINPPLLQPANPDSETLNSSASGILNPEEPNIPSENPKILSDIQVSPELRPCAQRDDESYEVDLPVQAIQEELQIVGNPVAIPPSSPLSPDEDPRHELFNLLMSGGRDGDSMPLETPNPTQETTEREDSYHPTLSPPSNPSDVSRLREEAEDREVEGYSITLLETMRMIASENNEGVKRIVTKYRVQCKALQSEQEVLKRQIRHEKDMGAAMSSQLKQNRETLKQKMEDHTRLRNEYDAKKEEVSRLTEQLCQKEGELQSLRRKLAEQNNKLTEQMPIANPCREKAQLSETISEAQAYLNAIMKLMPDENSIKDELERQKRINKGRPVTTGMLHSEPAKTKKKQ